MKKIIKQLKSVTVKLKKVTTFEARKLTTVK